MRMREGNAVLDNGLGAGTGRCWRGRPSPSPRFPGAGCHSPAQAGLLGRGASGRACSQSSPHSSATDLVPPAALAGEQTENQRNQTTQTRAQSPARDRVLRVASSNAAPSLSGLLPLHHPPSLHVCEAVQTRGKMRPRAPQGREPHTSRWPSQEGTFFYISPHPESESGMQKPTPS